MKKTILLFLLKETYATKSEATHLMSGFKNSIKAGLSLPKVLVDKDGNETRVPPKDNHPVYSSSSDDSEYSEYSDDSDDIDDFE